MKKQWIRFSDEYALIEKQMLPKDVVYEYIEDKLNDSKNWSMKKVMDTYLRRIYELKISGEVVELRFPKAYDETNRRYIKDFDEFCKISRKREIFKLKLAGLLLGLGISGLALAEKYEVTDKIVGIVSDFIDDTKFTLGNLSEIIDINELENELRFHSGHGSIDGYSQSITDHKNSYCSLGSRLEPEEVPQKIDEYCEENNLGDKVSNSAKEKLELLLDGDLDEAREIDLLDIYKQDKIKTFK